MFQQIFCEIFTLLFLENGTYFSANLIMTELLLACASDFQLLDFSLGLLDWLFKLEKIDWTVPYLPERVTRCFVRLLENASSDVVRKDKIKRCYLTFTEHIICKFLISKLLFLNFILANMAKTDPHENFMQVYLKYCKLLLHVAKSDCLNGTFLTSVNIFSFL